MASSDLLSALFGPTAPVITDREHSVENGKLLRVSVTQIKDFDDSEPEGCPRRWYYHKVEHLPKPTFSFQLNGVEMHKQYEHYFKTDQDVLGELAREGKRFQPMPGPDLLVEYPIKIEIEGIELRGFGDLAHARDPFEPALFDHKTTSDKKWAKDKAKLAKDVQQIVYSKDAVLRWPTAERVRFQLTYHLTKGGRIGEKAWPVSVVVPVAEVEQKWLTVKHKVAAMKQAAMAPSPEEVRAADNVEACKAYRGCPYQDRCSRAPHRRPDVDILDSLGLFEEEAPPVPVVAPAAPKPSLIEDESKVPDEVLKANPNRGQPPDKAGWVEVSCQAGHMVGKRPPPGYVVDSAACEECKAKRLDPRIVANGVLPPDAPKSDPDAETLSVAEPPPTPPADEKKTRKPRTVKGKNTVTAPDGTSEVTAVNEVQTKAEPPKVENVAPAPVQAPPPVAPAPADPTVSAPVFALFIDCIPEGATFERLEAYAQELAQKIADKAGVPDIRVQEQGPLSHGKWKGVLAAMARSNKPTGPYVVSTGSGEITSTVLEALLPFAGYRVRGLR